jgi:hypothetical protein
MKLVGKLLYEPKPRWCGGVFGYVGHRFPIRGGISWLDVLARITMRDNPLFKMLTSKKRDI